ncbi:MAG: hypothetical protein H6739_20560 [Alphaproteobacteria bacterium]|nr:hypothetical protein [Alphaproteobacteria bacterium]
MSVVSSLIGLLYLALQLAALAAAVIFVRPNLPRFLLAGGFGVLLLSGAFSQALWTIFGAELYSASLHLAEGIRFAFTLIELAAYLVVFAGFALMKPAAPPSS